jgi:hypothetical protein
MLDEKISFLDSKFMSNLEKLREILLKAKSYLQPVFENEVSLYLYKNCVRMGPGRTYFRDFLGLNDTKGKKSYSNDDDALFSTAQAINILLSTWAYQKADNDTQQRLAWKKHTPQYIKDLVNTSSQWLKENVLGDDFKPLNAFFSGSDKGVNTVPFWYPANFAQFFNGTNIDPTTASRKQVNMDELFNGVQGSIDEGKYEEMLKQFHYGERTPLEFHGYNQKEEIFPFWSSEPYTYAVSFLALAKFNNIE